MMKDQVNALSIGEAHVWHHDCRNAPHTDETAIEYRINGLPSLLTAELANLGPPAPGMERWLFHVHGPQPLRSEDRYGSKKAAFAALKDWLQENA